MAMELKGEGGLGQVRSGRPRPPPSFSLLHPYRAIRLDSWNRVIIINRLSLFLLLSFKTINRNNFVSATEL